MLFSNTKLSNTHFISQNLSNWDLKKSIKTTFLKQKCKNHYSNISFIIYGNGKVVENLFLDPIYNVLVY